jgi:SAM-dependent methyltransferase
MRIPLLNRLRKPYANGDTGDGVDEFDANEFRKREPFRGEYQIVSDALVSLLDFHSALDIGCGNGFLLEPLVRAGKDVHGVELSGAVVGLLSEDLRSRVRIGDATTMGKLGEFDLVACVEVAEHLPPERTDALLDVVTANSKSWLYFTAASPYQPGHGHINLRPIFFYLNALKRRGFDLDYGATDAMLEKLSVLTKAPWLHYNSLVFRRSS